MTPTTKRTEYFDYLRILATFSVIVIHIAAEYFFDVPVTSPQWQALNIFDSLARWSVPMFVMISGSLFLSRQPDTKAIYSKYILRIVTAFCFWSAAYILYFATVKDKVFTKRTLIATFIDGHFHLWFCFMIVGLYIVIPILSKIAEDEKILKYFFLVSFVFVFTKPLIINFLNIVFPEMAVAVSNGFSDANMQLVSGYAFYFFAGYYLNKTDIRRVWRIVIYLAGIISFVFIILITYKLSLHSGKPVLGFYEYLSPNVMITAVSIFVFAKYNLNNLPFREKFKKFIRNLSVYSFGAYLVHMIIIYEFERFGHTALTHSPWLSLPLLSVAVFIISLIISAVLNHIPFIKKYFV